MKAQNPSLSSTDTHTCLYLSLG